MKKILIVCIIILGLNHNVFGQDQDEYTEKQKQNERKCTIQTSPLLLFCDFFVGELIDTLFIMDLETQFKLSKYSNFSITLSFLYNDRTINSPDSNSAGAREDSDNKETYFQVGFKPMYIYRPFGTGLKGFFLGFYPNISFRYNVIGDIYEYYTEVGFGINIGHKWIFDSGFTMQIGGGLGKSFSFPPKSDNNSFINSDGRLTIIHSDIFIDFKLGYSF